MKSSDGEKKMTFEEAKNLRTFKHCHREWLTTGEEVKPS